MHDPSRVDKLESTEEVVGDVQDGLLVYGRIHSKDLLEVTLNVLEY